MRMLLLALSCATAACHSDGLVDGIGDAGRSLTDAAAPPDMLRICPRGVEHSLLVPGQTCRYGGDQTCWCTDCSTPQFAACACTGFWERDAPHVFCGDGGQ